MSKKRDLTKLVDTTPLPSDSSPVASAREGLPSVALAQDGLSPDPKLQEQTLTARTIRFSQDDEAEIDRIDDYLRERGLKRTDATKIIRLALKAAFRNVSDEDLRAYHKEIQIKHARGKKPD